MKRPRIKLSPPWASSSTARSRSSASTRLVQPSERKSPATPRLAVAGRHLGILFYISFAFRGIPHAFRYGTAAIIAMLHDVAVVLGVSAIFGKLFGWEIDSLFLTALLTVIGFSVHDTIVVFDRIRENQTIYRNLPFMTVVNHSIVQTLDRSINTQLTVMFTLAALALFGGVTIRHFVVILLVGVFSGTYSSIFNAAPILVVWENQEWKNWFKPRDKNPAWQTPIDPHSMMNRRPWQVSGSYILPKLKTYGRLSRMNWSTDLRRLSEGLAIGPGGVPQVLASRLDRLDRQSAVRDLAVLTETLVEGKDCRRAVVFGLGLIYPGFEFIQGSPQGIDILTLAQEPVDRLVDPGDDLFGPIDPLSLPVEGLQLGLVQLLQPGDPAGLCVSLSAALSPAPSNIRDLGRRLRRSSRRDGAGGGGRQEQARRQAEDYQSHDRFLE